MNKLELIEQVAEKANLKKVQAEKAVEQFLSSIKSALESGTEVKLIGFGTFSVAERAARKGRNPQTGEEIEIQAARIPKFKPGSALKDAVNH